MLPIAEDCAYLAGIIDGEGNLRFTKNGPNTRTAQLCVTNTNLDLILWIRERFGGRVYERKPRSVRHKAAYVIVWNSNKAVEVLRMVMPYLVIKKPQAKILEDYTSTAIRSGWTGKRGLPREIVEYRDGLNDQIRDLNRRGVN